MKAKKEFPITEATEHTVFGYWCPQCQKVVFASVPDAMPNSRIGFGIVIYSAWLHYFVGVSVRNMVRILWESSKFKITPGGLTQAWKKLADLLTPYYDTIEQNVKTSAVLHADETGWRINGSSHWLWCFADKAYCYYVISKSRGSPVIKKVLGQIFKGVLICDFFGAYNKIEALAKQRCFFHLATDLEKTSKRNHSDQWQFFRKKLYRLMNDAVRLSKKGDQMDSDKYVHRIDRFYERLDQLIVLPGDDKDVNRLRKRLSRHRNELFTFLDCVNVSPYNNHAEQQRRRPVISRKISQQNRSADGAFTQAVLMSIFKTFDLQNLNPLEATLSISKKAVMGRIASNWRMDEAS